VGGQGLALSLHRYWAQIRPKLKLFAVIVFFILALSPAAGGQSATIRLGSFGLVG
jgi:hypothetical protein